MNSIQNNTPLNELKGKVIVIDASIYIYKFIENNALLENMYLLISLFIESGIIPVFIFDGKPPPEKRELLYQRKLKKKEAENLYNEMKLLPDTNPHKLQSLQKQFLKMNFNHVQLTQQMLTAYGIQYFVSNGEADELCAQMVLSNKAWACMSDDMDMFVYGCMRVIRCLNLLNKTCTVYYLEHILTNLNMTMDSFRQIVVLSGTDYYNNNNQLNLYNIVKWHKQYDNEIKTMDNKMDFYEWVSIHYNIENIDIFRKILEKFIIPPDIDNTLFADNIEFTIKEKNKHDILLLLTKEGFLLEKEII